MTPAALEVMLRDARRDAVPGEVAAILRQHLLLELLAEADPCLAVLEVIGAGGPLDHGDRLAVLADEVDEAVPHRFEAARVVLSLQPPAAAAFSSRERATLTVNSPQPAHVVGS